MREVMRVGLSWASNFQLKRLQGIISFSPTIFIGILLTGLSMAANAADIQVESGASCELSLRGEIASGDYDRFLEVVEQASQNVTSWGQPVRFCLDSPGGALEDGLNIALAVRDWGIATRIGAGDQCLSSCAWIFMLGTTEQIPGLANGEYEYVDRIMDASATLGFHAPLVMSSDAGAVSQSLLASFAAILTVANDNNGLFPLIGSDLIEIAMSTPPDEMYFIETVDQAGRWGIGVTGISFENPIDEQAALNACLNATAWSIDLATEHYAEVMATWPPELRGSVTLSSDRSSFDVVGPFNGYDYHGCQIDRNIFITPAEQETEYSGDYHINGCFTHGAYSYEYCGLYSVLALFPADLSLSELGAEQGSPPQPTLSCSVGANQDLVRVTNVNEYVNIRTGPSLQDSIVSRANLGERLTISRQGFWYYDTARGRQCADFCERLASRTNDRSLTSQVRSCIQDAQIWQQVRNWRGQTGYVSVYFLEATGQ